MLKKLNKESILQEKIILKKEIKKDKYNRQMIIYTNDYYKIIHISDEENNFYKVIKKTNFVPDINIELDKKESILIQNNHNYIEIEEAEKVAEGYQIAVETIKQLKKILKIDIEEIYRVVGIKYNGDIDTIFKGNNKKCKEYYNKYCEKEEIDSPYNFYEIIPLKNIYIK